MVRLISRTEEIIKDLVFSPQGFDIIVVDDPSDIEVTFNSILTELKEHPYLYGEQFISRKRSVGRGFHIFLINNNTVRFVPADLSRIDCYLCGVQADKIYNFSSLSLDKELMRCLKERNYDNIKQ